ncbi:MAG: uracil-DNA glycosylase [Rhizobiaceae bacterium]|nr:uracil-DNA glycosylase [Rhizobiaceae bacterium]
MPPIAPDMRARLRDLLEFYASAGVDEALLEQPVDRFAARPETKPARSAPAAPPAAANSGIAAPRQEEAPRFAAPQGSAAIPDEAQANRARELAAAATSLDELREILAGFDGCNLKLTAKNMVFSDGNPAGPLMLVGEAPGRDEDLEGLPFVGRSGQLLDRILAAIGLDRTAAYIANVVPWRPPGNRTPTPLETEICRPFIERQIELASPRVLVALGGPSAKLLLNTTDGILRLRGNWRMHVTRSGKSIPTMPTLHPAYLLRNPAHKKLAWRDFLEVRARLKTLAGDPH